MNNKYLIIVGNPVDGLQFIGPFDTAEAARKYGDSDDNPTDNVGDWWIAEMQSPDQ